MKKYKTCRLPWDNVNILANGEVKPCCWCVGNVGNLNDKSLDEIWNGEAITELRESIVNDEIHDMCANAPCPYHTERETDEE